MEKKFQEKHSFDINSSNNSCNVYDCAVIKRRDRHNKRVFVQDPSLKTEKINSSKQPS